MSEFGPCMMCPEDSIVKLNGRAYCMEHYKSIMRDVGSMIREVVREAPQ